VRASSWSPELLAAAATLVIAAAAQSQTRVQFLPTAADVSLAGAVTVIVAALLQPLLRRTRPALQFVVALLVTILAFTAVSFGVYYQETAPGRQALSAAGRWRTVNVPQHLPLGSVVGAGTTRYGTGWGSEEYRGVFKVHVQSTLSNVIAWFPSDSVSADTYYAQVQAKVLNGSIATACALLFAYRGSNAFYQLALRSDGLQLAYWDGSIPARAYEGPVALPYASDLSRWNTIAVRVERGTVTAYVDDRRVFSDYLGRTSGGLDFGALDIGSGYTDSGTCEFRNVTFRAQ
jgi:hypothetical protein